MVSEVWVVITDGVREVEVDTAASLRVVVGGSGGRDVEEEGGSKVDEVEVGEVEVGVRIAVLEDDGDDLQAGRRHTSKARATKTGQH